MLDISHEKPYCLARSHSPRQRACHVTCFSAHLLSVAGAATGAAAGAWSPACATTAAFGKQRRLPDILGRCEGRDRVGFVTYGDGQRGGLGRGFV